MALPKLTNNVREVMRIAGLSHSGAYRRWRRFVKGDIGIEVLLSPNQRNNAAYAAIKRIQRDVSGLSYSGAVWRYYNKPEDARLVPKFVGCWSHTGIEGFCRG